MTEKETSLLFSGKGEGAGEKNKTDVEILTTLIRAISGDYSLGVTTKIDPITRMQLMAQGQDPDNAYYCRTELNPITKKFIRRYVRVPEVTSENKTVVKGKSAHEAGHVAISRLAEFVPDEVAKEIGFTSLMMAAEERPTDQVIRERFPGAGDWIDFARSQELIRSSVVDDAREKLGRAPKFAQLCNLIVYGPHMKGDFYGYDPGVVRLYKETVNPKVNEIEKTLPKEKASEDEVVKMAQCRYAITYKDIWPSVKSLVEADIQEQTLRDMAQQSQQQEELRKSLEELPEEMKKELEEMLNEMEETKKAAKEKKKERGKGEKTNEESSEEKPGKPENSSDDVTSESGQEKSKESQEQKEGQAEEEGTSAQDHKGESNQGESNPEGQEEGRQEGDEQSERDEEGATGEKTSSQETEEGGEGSGSVSEESVGTNSQGTGEDSNTDQAEEGASQNSESMDLNTEGSRMAGGSMSEALRKSLQEIFDRLPESLKNKLQDMAKEDLENLEDTIAKTMEGKFAQKEDPKIKSHEELRREEKAEKDAKEQAAKSTLDREREAIDAVGKGDKGTYENIYQEVRTLDEALYSELDAILNPSQKQAIKLKPAGSNLNLKAVYKRESQIAAGSSEIEDKIFEAREIPDKRDYIFSIIVDVSGSMSGQKIIETSKALVLLSEVLNRLKVKFEIRVFSDGTELIKDSDKELDNAARERIGKGIRLGGGTNTHLALSESNASMVNAREKEKFAIVLTDGFPNSESETNKELKALAKNDIKVIGLGLGPQSEGVDKLFPVGVSNIKVEELSNVIGDLFRNIISNPNQFE